MRYKKFKISNFKGVKQAELDLSSLTGANVFALVGLNESGKTTLLEALHSFSPDYRSGTIVKLYGGTEREQVQGRVPRHQIASFSGEIVVEATVEVSHADKQNVVSFLKTENSLLVNENVIPDEVILSRVDIFERGDFVRTERRLNFSPRLRSLKQRKDRSASDEEAQGVWSAIWEYVPDIAYYPTFIFQFPERIYLTYRPGAYDTFYQSVFQDILAVDGQGYTLSDITRRVRSEKFKVPWLDFFPAWMKGDDRSKIQQIIDRASAAVTRTVFGKWNQIFKEDVLGKEIVIEYDIEEGRTLNVQQKVYEKSNDHDVYVWFEIKDGTRRFRVNDRSLGFRWFFAFLLFTQFRVSRQASRNVLFLFDEPASNLHAAAQQKLIESFPEIARGDNMLLYTTHSHYMIDPAWLEQTFIVTNRAEAPADTIVDTATLDDESLDIQAHRYRNFVNRYPNETSYFQPIVDRLEVVPSKFDYNVPSIVVEGKSDYYVLAYAAKLVGTGELRLLPAVGSGTFGALIALSSGWGIKFLFFLDADKAGKKEQRRYALDLGAPERALCTIDEFVDGASEIEGLLDDDARNIIKAELGSPEKLSKKQILRFFQEYLARGKTISLGKEFERRSSKLLKGLQARLASL